MPYISWPVAFVLIAIIASVTAVVCVVMLTRAINAAASHTLTPRARPDASADAPARPRRFRL